MSADQIEVEHDNAHSGHCNCTGCEAPAVIRVTVIDMRILVSHWLCMAHAEELQSKLTLEVDSPATMA